MRARKTWRRDYPDGESRRARTPRTEASVERAARAAKSSLRPHFGAPRGIVGY